MTLDLRAALCQTPLLDGVPSDLLDRLIDQGTVRQVRAGEQLFAASDMSNTVFFILAGSLRIYSRDETSPVPLADLGAGDVVGELAAIDGGGRTGSATALQESAVLVCPPRCLHRPAKPRPAGSPSVVAAVFADHPRCR
ncbi:hypothetical protein GCM10011497_14760 [Elstera cyanobacteriorum]|nr:Crp/Fnr family transcriptional regulator [Elstera cyanobacteriorum]GFZ86598.1 hypothetical protein GCM10011497_14760 [Elstera cyanobacteriorum]